MSNFSTPGLEFRVLREFGFKGLWGLRDLGVLKGFRALRDLGFKGV